MIGLLFFTLCAQSALADGLSPHAIAARLQEVYKQTNTLAADFTQVASSITGRHQRHGAGTLFLMKPGRMRWNYTKPDKQVLVCDGQTISMYFAKEHQMVVNSAKQYLEADVTYSFFAGTGDILRDFEAMAPDPKEQEQMGSAYQIKIVPKHGRSQVDFINLWVDAESFLLKRIRVTDKFGSQTDITFSHIRRNIKMDPAVFNFTPPQGTEIIKQ